MSTWLPALRRVSPRPGSRRPLRYRPIVESLEDRCLLDAGFVQTNLVSDVPGLASHTDPNLKNPWGLAASAKGPWWVSDNNAGVSTLYKGDGTILPLVVSIPAPGGGPGGTPTGIVFNGTGGFAVSQNGTSGSSFFIFATEDGVIAGWNPNVNLTSAVVAVDNSGSGAVYKGLAIGHNDSGNFIYATNFHDGTVDVFDTNFSPTTLSGSFTDPKLPDGYAPFGIQNIKDKLYVTYAMQNAAKHDDVAGPGHGFVDEFDTSGNLIKRLISQGHLNSPWGLALAPDDFGDFDNRLLVGNFGDGTINAYNIHNGKFKGTMEDQSGNLISIEGLWGLKFGNGGQAGDTHTLFFTAGINHEADGLFGTLTPAEEHGDNQHGGNHEGAHDDRAAIVTVLGHERQANPGPVVNPLSSSVASARLSQQSRSLLPHPQQPPKPQAETAVYLRSAHRTAVDLAFGGLHFGLSD